MESYGGQCPTESSVSNVNLPNPNKTRMYDSIGNDCSNVPAIESSQTNADISTTSRENSINSLKLDSSDYAIESETDKLKLDSSKTFCNNDSDNIDTLSALSDKTSLCNSESPTSNCNDDTDEQTHSLDRPDSLNLPRPLQYYERQRYQTDDSSGPQSVSSSEHSFGSHPKGTYTRTGDMVEFVADNLQQKIKNSRESSSMGSRTSSVNSLSSITSTSMATSYSGMSRSPSSLIQHSPDDIPSIDPLAVIDLEKRAKVVADHLDLMMGNLKSNLHKMSAITAGCVDAYKQSVDYTCENVDAAIKAMYTLMARCEELSKSVTPVYQLANQIKEIKRLLDLFEFSMDKRT